MPHWATEKKKIVLAKKSELGIKTFLVSFLVFNLGQPTHRTLVHAVHRDIVCHDTTKTTLFSFKTTRRFFFEKNKNKTKHTVFERDKNLRSAGRWERELASSIGWCRKLEILLLFYTFLCHVGHNSNFIHRYAFVGCALFLLTGWFFFLSRITRNLHHYFLP